MESHMRKIKSIFVFVIGIAILINVVQYHKVHWFEFKTWSTPHHRILAENTPTIEAEIRNSTNTEEEIMNSTRTEEEIMNSTRTEEEIMNSTRTEEEIMNSTRTEEEIMNSTRTEEEIMDSTRTEEEIMNSARTEEEIMNSARTEEEIMDSTRTEEEIMNSTRTEEEIMNSARTEEEIMNSTRTEEEIMNSARTEEEIMNSSETEEEIMNSTTINDKVTNIAFLKVHKAGSTTMQNLLFRFGLRHKLNILLPTTGNYLFSMQKVIPLPPSQTYNIFAIHTSYSKSFFKKLIPDKEAVHIAIVREPIDRLISGAYYYRYVLNRKPLVDIPEKDFIRNLINYPELYDKELFSNTRNKMGADFGFGSLKNPLDKKVIELRLNNLNNSFLLVMIMERINESLVMLKRRLSWSFLDIIYLKSNSNKHNKISLNATELEKVRNTNAIDFAIYEYFSKEFESKLKTMSSDFDAEVIHYRGILKQVSSFCASQDLQDESKVMINGSVWESNFVVTGEECRWMHTDEGTFIQHLRQKYMPFSKP